MFLTTLTSLEVCNRLKSIHGELQEAWVRKISKSSRKWINLIKKAPTKCASPRDTCHTTQDGVRFHLLPVGLYHTRFKGLDRIESNTYWLYFKVRDTNTGSLVGYITRPSDSYVIRVEPHALSRYRTRHMNSEAGCDEILDQIVYNNAIYLHVLSTTMYGSSEYKFLESSRCRDGVFLGYYDAKLETHVFTTFITVEQLNKEQYYQSADSEQVKKFLDLEKNIRTVPNVYLPQEGYQVMVSDLVEDRKILRKMTKEEEEAYRTSEPLSADELEEIHKIHSNEVKRRWKRKMFNRGLK